MQRRSPHRIPLGAASGGFLVDRTSAPAVLTGCGGLMILIAVVSAVVLRLDGRHSNVADLAAPHTACLDEVLPDDAIVQ